MGLSIIIPVVEMQQDGGAGLCPIFLHPIYRIINQLPLIDQLCPCITYKALSNTMIPLKVGSYFFKVIADEFDIFHLNPFPLPVILYGIPFCNDSLS